MALRAKRHQIFQLRLPTLRHRDPVVNMQEPGMPAARVLAPVIVPCQNLSSDPRRDDRATTAILALNRGIACGALKKGFIHLEIAAGIGEGGLAAGGALVDDYQVFGAHGLLASLAVINPSHSFQQKFLF